MSSFRDLVAWQKAMDLVESAYAVTREFPSEERYGLIAQIRRSAVSIPANIAEGHGRMTTKDWQHFLAQARGSALELETELLIAARLGIAQRARLEEVIERAQEVGRIINGLLNSTANRLRRKY
jgi:four helix bundle protein